MSQSVLSPELRRALENGIPAVIASVSKDGQPNVTPLSRVYFVDGDTVALSFQFFSKTIRNIRENPRVAVLIQDIPNATEHHLSLEYDHTETEGPVFDEMDMHIEAIASMTGMKGVFKLRGADIYRVLGRREVRLGIGQG